MTEHITPDGRLGRVEGKLDALISATEKAERVASDSRGRMHRMLEQVSSEVRKLSGDQASIEHRLTAIETTLDRKVLPVIDRVEALEQRASGATWAGGHAWRAARWVGGTAVAALVMFWRELLDVIRG